MIVAHLPYLTGKRIVLASQSPRRREILGLLGLTKFVVTPSAFDESTLNKGAFASATEYVQASATAKMRDVANGDREADVVLGADTVVIVDGQILEKPPSEAVAMEMLRKISGRAHDVATGVAIRTKGGKEVVFAELTRVVVAPLDDDAIAAYVRTGEPLDKAGAYGIQGIGGAFVQQINGCFFNVMGLPMHRVAQELSQLIQSGAL